VTEQGGSSIVLPDYTGAAVAGQRLGSAFYEREMTLRRALAALGRHDVPNGHKLDDVVYLGKGPLARQLQALGLLGRLDAGGLAGDTSPALDDLRRAIGAQRLRQALINLSTTRSTPNDDVSTACALYHLTGRPITTWVNHYLVSETAIKPPGGCR
jgi:hypothetical protein